MHDPLETSDQGDPDELPARDSEASGALTSRELDQATPSALGHPLLSGLIGALIGSLVSGVVALSLADKASRESRELAERAFSESRDLVERAFRESRDLAKQASQESRELAEEAALGSRDLERRLLVSGLYAGLVVDAMALEAALDSALEWADQTQDWSSPSALESNFREWNSRMTEIVELGDRFSRHSIQIVALEDRSSLRPVALRLAALSKSRTETASTANFLVGLGLSLERRTGLRPAGADYETFGYGIRAVLCAAVDSAQWGWQDALFALKQMSHEQQFTWSGLEGGLLPNEARLAEIAMAYPLKLGLDAGQSEGAVEEDRLAIDSTTLWLCRSSLQALAEQYGEHREKRRLKIDTSYEEACSLLVDNLLSLSDSMSVLVYDNYERFFDGFASGGEFAEILREGSDIRSDMKIVDSYCTCVQSCIELESRLRSWGQRSGGPQRERTWVEYYAELTIERVSGLLEELRQRAEEGQ